MAAGEAKNYYEVLGVPATASTEEIKKRYRALARQHHPDVNPNDPGAARKFADVAEAYRTLSDSTTRAVHDFELKKLQDRQDAARRRAAAAASPASGAAAPSGRAASPATSSAPPASSAATAGSESARLVAQAQAAFVRNRLVEARTLAEQALRLNRRNAQAYEVLGDVFRLQNRTEDAQNMYSMALQINPRNRALMERLERMSRASAARAGSYGPAFRSAPQRPAPPSSPPPSKASGSHVPPPPGSPAGSAYRPASPSYTPRPAPAAPPSAGYYDEDRRPGKRPIGMLLWGVAGYGFVGLAVLYAALFHGEAPPRNALPLALEAVSTWNLTILAIMALCGAVLGMTMSATLAIRRIEDELILPTAGSGGVAIPLGSVLMILSVLSFDAAALLYLLLQYFQEAVTPSILRVFGAVFVVVSLLALAYEPGRMQVFWFGGNVVFLSYLIGWAIGDMFRPYGL